MKPWLVLTAFLSFSVLADVSFDEKKNRVDFLAELQKEAPAMDIEAYHRELNYEKLDLTLTERAQNEAQLIAEQIKKRISESYEAALQEKSPEEAASEIRDAIERDTKLMARDLRGEVKIYALQVLEDLQRGVISSEYTLVGIEKVLIKDIRERSNFLNEEGAEIVLHGKDINELSTVKASDADRKEYKSKAELLSSLVSDRSSAGWTSSGNATLKSSAIVKKDANISLNVKAEFLGVALSTGPNFTFKREYSTDVQIISEGLTSPLMSDGNFDFYVRDMNGKVKKENGKNKKRFIAFWCEADLIFSTEASNGAGFTVMNVGGGVSVTSIYKNTVNLSSRRISVPEYIDGKTATFAYLSRLCHSDFLSAKITNTQTVSGSLNLMMRNVVASLRYSNPKSKCAQDSHCQKWFNTEVMTILKNGNVARCVEETREKFFSCQLRGSRGQNCPVFDSKGKRVSSGMAEFTCDKGLKCVKVQEEGFFKGWDLYQYAKGQCR